MSDIVAFDFEFLCVKIIYLLVSCSDFETQYLFLFVTNKQSSVGL